jgi:hypothetical protein
MTTTQEINNRVELIEEELIDYGVRPHIAEEINDLPKWAFQKLFERWKHWWSEHGREMENDLYAEAAETDAFFYHQAVERGLVGEQTGAA